MSCWVEFEDHNFSGDLYVPQLANQISTPRTSSIKLMITTGVKDKKNSVRGKKDVEIVREYIL